MGSARIHECYHILLYIQVWIQLYAPIGVWFSVALINTVMLCCFKGIL